MIRRKEQHRFWGVDCYSSDEDRYLRIGNRTFYEDPDQEVEPSAQIVVASGLGQGTGQEHPFGRHADPVLHPRRDVHPGGGTAPFPRPKPIPRWDVHFGGLEDARQDSTAPHITFRDQLGGHRQCGLAICTFHLGFSLVSDPSGYPVVGRPEMADIWLWQNPDAAAIDGRLAHRLFLTICQFPAMRASWLAKVARGSPREVSRHLGRFVDTGLVAVFDGRHYLSELGMRRAANMSRVLPSVIRSRHGAYLDRWYREHEQAHNDGLNRLVVRFAREGVAAVADWRGEVNVPGLTPGAARPAGAGEPGTLRGRSLLHRVRAQRGVALRGESQVGALPLDGGGGTPVAPAGGVRDGPGRGKLPGYGPRTAYADCHSGAGAGRAGGRSGYSVELERGSSGVALSQASGLNSEGPLLWLRPAHPQCR